MKTMKHTKFVSFQFRFRFQEGIMGTNVLLPRIKRVSSITKIAGNFCVVLSYVFPGKLWSLKIL